MSVIRFPRVSEDFGTPLFLFVDLQREYVIDGRAHALRHHEPWSGNCLRLLDFARKRGYPIAHFRLLKREPFFNRATPFAEWIEEFRPWPHEMVFERSMPSCYANESFAALLDSLSRPHFVLAGLTCETNCLATVFDAHHRGHRALLVVDASASRGLGDRTEAQVHEVATQIAESLCDVATTTEVVARFAGRKPSLAG